MVVVKTLVCSLAVLVAAGASAATLENEKVRVEIGSWDGIGSPKVAVDGASVSLELAANELAVVSFRK